MKALVTGATGLIGRHLVTRLTDPRVLARDPERARLELGIAEALAWDSGTSVPAAALRLALGDMADVVMASQRVMPVKAEASGYRFRFETLDEALRDLISPAGARVEAGVVHP